jgi:hypothetical protein
MKREVMKTKLHPHREHGIVHHSKVEEKKRRNWLYRYERTLTSTRIRPLLITSRQPLPNQKYIQLSFMRQLAILFPSHAAMHTIHNHFNPISSLALFKGRKKEEKKPSNKSQVLNCANFSASAGSLGG